MINLLLSIQEQYETSCPTIGQNIQPTVNIYANSTNNQVNINVGVPFESYALYQISFSQNEISEYSNVIYNLTFPNSEGATDAAQLCYDQLTYFNLSYWKYRVDSCNYINWEISLPDDASVLQVDNPAIWITIYNKNGEIIQQTVRYIQGYQLLQIYPQTFTMPNQIDGQYPQVYQITGDDEIQIMKIVIPSYANVTSIEVQQAELINYTSSQKEGIIIYISQSYDAEITIHYCYDNAQTQNVQQFQLSFIVIDPQSLYYQSIYPQLNISVADDKYVISNMSTNVVAYKCNDSDTKAVFSTNMTISKKCQILTLYTALPVNDQIQTIQEYKFDIGSTFQLYGNYVHRKGDIFSTEQVMAGSVCQFVNYQRYLYEKSLSSDSVAGTATVIGGIAAAAGAALLKGEL